MSSNDSMYKSWKIPFILAIFFFASTFDLQYGFYTIFKICVFFLSGYFAICCFSSGDNFSAIINALIAIIWNPILPIYLDKATWVFLDIIALTIECILGLWTYFFWKKSFNTIECTNCGKSSPLPAIYCTHCGRKFN